MASDLIRSGPRSITCPNIAMLMRFSKVMILCTRSRDFSLIPNISQARNTGHNFLNTNWLQSFLQNSKSLIVQNLVRGDVASVRRSKEEVQVHKAAAAIDS